MPRLGTRRLVRLVLAALTLCLNVGAAYGLYLLVTDVLLPLVR
jgi:hypothetical protein